MVHDETLPRAKDEFKPRFLEKLSVPELEIYVRELQTEIARVEEEIKRKGDYKSAADSFFKK